MTSLWKLRAEGESDEAYARRPLYARENRFWKAKYVREMVGDLEEGEKKENLKRQVERVLERYAELWKRYKEVPRPPGSGDPEA